MHVTRRTIRTVTVARGLAVAGLALLAATPPAVAMNEDESHLGVTADVGTEPTVDVRRLLHDIDTPLQLGATSSRMVLEPPPQPTGDGSTDEGSVEIGPVALGALAGAAVTGVAA